MTAKNLSLVLLLLCISIAISETLGLIMVDSSRVFDGYTLFAPIEYNETYLIDIEGNLVHKWISSTVPGQSVYLLPDGRLLRPCTPIEPNPIFSGGGEGGEIQIIDWDGTVVWDFLFSDSTHLSHHDVEMMPSGNILFIAWEMKTMDEAIAAGRNPMFLSDSMLWPDMIVEVQPTGPTSGEIVWEWHSFDHIIQDFDSTKDNYGIIADNPGKIDINLVQGDGPADWLHVNAIDYNEELDQIVISSRKLSEFFVIDHSTADYSDPAAGIAAAAGPAGDIIYRWGNPNNYDRGDESDEMLFNQHDVHWIPSGLTGEGNFLIFNNGTSRPIPHYSSVDEITAPMDSFGNYILTPGAPFGPDTLVWTYVATPRTSFFANHVSGAQRLPNDNTLICSGNSGVFFEVTMDGTKVWEYVNPVNNTGPQYQGTDIIRNDVFRCYRYPADYPAFIGRDLTPEGTIELDTTSIAEKVIPKQYADISTYPNPFNSSVKITASAGAQIEICDMMGNVVFAMPVGTVSSRPIQKGTETAPLRNAPQTFIWHPAPTIVSGIYLVSIKGTNTTTKVIYMK